MCRMRRGAGKSGAGRLSEPHGQSDRLLPGVAASQPAKRTLHGTSRPESKNNPRRACPNAAYLTIFRSAPVFSAAAAQHLRMGGNLILLLPTCVNGYVAETKPHLSVLKKTGKKRILQAPNNSSLSLLGLPDLQQVVHKEERGDARRVCTQAPTLVLFDPAKTGRRSLTECCRSAIPGAPSRSDPDKRSRRRTIPDGLVPMPPT